MAFRARRRCRCSSTGEVRAAGEVRALDEARAAGRARWRRTLSARAAPAPRLWAGSTCSPARPRCK
eukprot:1653744-Prymnesium_polylepis.1